MSLRVRGPYRVPLRLVLFVCTPSILAGCGSSNEPHLSAVKGTVTLDGKPLPRGSIAFRPDAKGGNNSSHEPAGEIGSDGSYTLHTRTRPGAPLGKYVVTVQASEPADPKDPYGPEKSLVPTRYTDPDTSELRVEVVESPAPGTYDLKLKR
jgi:hypothetical protein